MVRMSELPDFETAYRAVQSRDPRFDGRLFLGRDLDGDLLPPVVPGADAQAGERPLLRDRSGGRRGRVPGLQAVPAGRPAGQPRLGPPRRPRRPRPAPGRGRGRRRRAASPGWPRQLHVSERHLHRTPRRRGRRRRAGAGQDPPRADRAAAHRPDGPHRSRTSRSPRGSRASGSSTTSCARSSAARRPSCDARCAAPPDPDGRTPGRGAPLVLRLVHREPYAASAWLRWQDAHAVPGLEEVVDGTYRRVLAHVQGAGRRRADACVRATSWRSLHLDDLGDLTPTVAALRRAADLDADPTAVDAALGADPHLRATRARGVPACASPVRSTGSRRRCEP